MPDPAPSSAPASNGTTLTLDDLLDRLRAHWVMALATRAGAEAAPYPTPLFYAAAPCPDGGIAMVFASDPASAHGRHLARWPDAAAAVYLETAEIGRIVGVQLRGRARVLAATDTALRQAYLDRHPVAADMLERGPARLYALRITWAKVTDNALGFGVHPVWEAPCGTPAPERPEDPAPMP